VSQLHALLQGDIAEGDEGDYVNCAYAGMTASVCFHIYAGDGGLGGVEQTALDGFRFTGKADHKTVVILVRPVVKEVASFLPAKWLNNSFNNLRPPSLAEVGDAFNQRLGHENTFLFLKASST
jgi:hypothetical protein